MSPKECPSSCWVLDSSETVKKEKLKKLKKKFFNHDQVENDSLRWQKRWSWRRMRKTRGRATKIKAIKKKHVNNKTETSTKKKLRRRSRRRGTTSATKPIEIISWWYFNTLKKKSEHKTKFSMERWKKSTTPSLIFGVILFFRDFVNCCIVCLICMSHK